MAEWISLLVDAFFGYMILGILFSIWFVFVGAKKLDDGVSETPWHFKLIIIPGAVFLWVILLAKIIKRR